MFRHCVTIKLQGAIYEIKMPLRHKFVDFRENSNYLLSLRASLSCEDWRIIHPWKNSDLEWWVPKDEDGIEHFQTIFDSIGLNKALSFMGDFTMLTGSYIVRKKTTTKHWHYDFSNTNKQAFTVMTPLQKTTDINLLYKKTTDSGPEYTYKYTLGEAIVFGDGFLHCTEPGVSSDVLFFLCFTCADKDMDEDVWDTTESIISGQCHIYKDLNGNVQYT